MLKIKENKKRKKKAEKGILGVKRTNILFSFTGELWPDDDDDNDNDEEKSDDNDDSDYHQPGDEIELNSSKRRKKSKTIRTKMNDQASTSDDNLHNDVDHEKRNKDDNDDDDDDIDNEKNDDYSSESDVKMIKKKKKMKTDDDNELRPDDKRKERITLKISKRKSKQKINKKKSKKQKTKNNRNSNNSNNSNDYFISNEKNSKLNRKSSTQRSNRSRKKEPYEDKDTRELKAEAVHNELYNGLKNNLSLKPFLIGNHSRINLNLPDHVLIKIFKYVVDRDNRKCVNNLMNLAKVCDEWRTLILSAPELWSSLDLSDFNYQTAEKDLLSLIDTGVLSRVKSISITGWNSTLTSTVLTKLLESCASYLTEINLRECHNIDSDTLLLMAEKCLKLKNVDVSRNSYTSFNPRPPNKQKGIHAKDKYLQASSLNSFLSICGARLTSLNLAENRLQSFLPIIRAITEHCENLQLLDLSNIETSTKPAIFVDQLQTTCPQIKILRLANIALRLTSPSSTAPGFPFLEELSIPVNGEHDLGHEDGIIYSLTRISENLNLLDIRGSKYVSISCLIKIPAWNLQHLSISNCQRLCSPDLEMVINKWKHSVIDLDISLNNNDASVNSSLDTLSDEDDSMLKSLNLRGSSVSFPSLKKLLRKCTKLEFLNLQSCRGLPRGIKRVLTEPEITKMREDIINGHYDFD